MAAADTVQLVVGGRILFQGLSGRADLNGTNGTLESWNADTGRWTVSLGTEESVNVLPKNLQAAPPKAVRGSKAIQEKEPPPAEIETEFSVGQHITFVGLAGRADLNGTRGTLKAWDPQAGRWAVDLGEGKGSVNVRPANLQVEPEPAAQRIPRAPRPKVVVGRFGAGKHAKAKAKAKARGTAAAGPAAPLPGSAKAKARGRPKGAPSVASSARAKAKTAPRRQTRSPGARPGAKRAAPQKPKRAPSAYMLFCNKYRQDVMDKQRAYGAVDLPSVARELGERWGDLEDKERAKYQRMAAKRKETQQAKMAAYQEAVDPIGSLRKKYAHLIPKRPKSAYFCFCTDEARRQQAAAELTAQKKRAADETRLASKMAELWKQLSAEERGPYERQYEAEKADFAAKDAAWRQTRQFKQLDKLEQGEREAKRAKKQEEKDAEEAEFQELLQEGAKAGVGLAEGRRATIVGLVSRPELNGKEVSLGAFDEAVERWSVEFVDASGETVNLRPQNLILTRLEKERQKSEKKLEGRVARQMQRNAELARKQAERDCQREGERAAKLAAREAKTAELARLREQEKAAKKAEAAVLREQQQALKAADAAYLKEQKQAAKARAKEAVEASRATLKEAQKAAAAAHKELRSQAMRAESSFDDEEACKARDTLTAWLED